MSKRDSSQGAPNWKVITAQGLGIGRIPVAPGTFGSLAGVLWSAALLQTGSVWIYVGATVLGLFFSVWICGEAERILQKRDPASVVLDEITALPICFLPWIFHHHHASTGIPSATNLFVLWHGGYWLCAFGLFRLFDIWKPWPIRQSQRLARGWGVTVDDVLAASYVAIVLLFIRPGL